MLKPAIGPGASFLRLAGRLLHHFHDLLAVVGIERSPSRFDLAVDQHALAREAHRASNHPGIARHRRCPFAGNSPIHALRIRVGDVATLGISCRLETRACAKQGAGLLIERGMSGGLDDFAAGDEPGRVDA